MRKQLPEKLQTLLDNNPNLWQGSAMSHGSNDGIGTGYSDLDAILPNHGWPKKSVLEILSPQWGIGELKIILPLMRKMTQQKRWVIWISPPHIPYAPALVKAGVDINYVIVINADTSCSDAIWSIEKALQTHSCALVLAWMNWLPNGVVRRLQLAAEKGDGLAILFRERETKNSPAALRLKLHPNAQGLQVKVLKARGTHRYQSAHLCFPESKDYSLMTSH